MLGAGVKILAAFAILLSTSFSWAETNESIVSVSESAPDLDAASAAEFRQGGSNILSQQLLHPASSVYAGGNGYQQLMAASGAAGTSAGYGNMLRQLYRPSSLGLTDKVRNWVKSFLNRRQYVKPYYNPSALLAYSGEDKPIYINGASYKPVSVPLRQLQKYFKPFYGSQPSAASSNAAAAESAVAQYFAAAGSPSFASLGGDSGLFASESSPSSPIFSSASGTGGIYGSLAGSPGLITSDSSSSNLFGSSVLSGSNFAPLRNYQFASSGIYPSSSGSIYSPSMSLQSGGSSDDLVQSSSGNSGSMYVPSSSSSGQNRESQQAGELPSGFAFDNSPGSFPVESTYSLTYQRPHRSPQTYSSAGSSFQPVSFGASDGSSFKAIPASSSGQSTSHSALYVADKTP